MRGVLLALLVLGAGLPAGAKDSTDSVVMVRCARANETAVATGFVWPRPGYVVTALHAVVGCKEIDVTQEAVGETIATGVVAVHLEADLALLQLRDTLKLAPVPIYDRMPDMRGDYEIWGYPLGVSDIINQHIDFAGGRKPLIELGRLPRAELDETFRKQKFPTPRTQIMRITSTIQPGHSGAPIFDRQGRVAAIADGGLKGGTVGINWSIPAHLYLPQLEASRDRLPTEVPPAGSLFAASLPPAKKVAVMMGDKGGTSGVLKLVRVVPISVVEADIRRNHRELLDGITLLKRTLKARYRSVTFDVYEEPVTGATIGVPSGVKVRWDKKMHALVAEDDRGDIVLRQTISVTRLADHQAARQYGLSTFIHGVVAAAKFDEDFKTIRYKSDGPDYSYYNAETEGVDRATNEYADITICLDIWDRDFLGTALYIIGAADAFDDEDEAMAWLFDIGALHITDFAVK